MFHIIVHMSDTPGSLSAILTDLGKRVNIIGLSSYALTDGTAMFTAFAEALNQKETPKTLKGAIDKLGASLEAEVAEGRKGLLVDTYHTGIQVGGDEYLLLRREGLSGVFDHIVRIFGTGGEVLLYEEGKALGHDNAEKLTKELGEMAVDEAAYIDRALTAQGWGVVESSTTPGSKDFTIKVDDCFECSGKGSPRKGCDFLRGYYEGSVETARGFKPKVEETECRLRGDKGCAFRVRS